MSEYIGKTIGEYQLITMTAEDENTWVFKGFQPNMNRYVMVTALKPHVGNDTANVQVFLQAAQLATQMHHPNILPVYAAGQAEGLTYRVTPFSEGGTLHEKLTLFQETNSMLNLFRQITAGLEYIHTQGYVYGNLKSANIYLNAQNAPLLGNIGAAVMHSAAIDAYMSPEQVQGGSVDRRSDIYALGVLLYEVLVGEAPPPGMVVSLRAKRPDLPESIERVILKSMAQNPDQRFQSATEFQIALQKAVETPAQPDALPPIPAPAISQNVQVSQPKGTNWTAIILGMLLVIIICGGISFFILPRMMDGKETGGVQPTVEQPTIAPPPEQPTELPPEEPPAQLPELPSEPPDNGLPDICGSIGGVGGLAVLVVVLTKKRHDLP